MLNDMKHAMIICNDGSMCAVLSRNTSHKPGKRQRQRLQGSASQDTTEYEAVTTHCDDALPTGELPG